MWERSELRGPVLQADSGIELRVCGCGDNPCVCVCVCVEEVESVSWLTRTPGSSLSQGRGVVLTTDPLSHMPPC